MIAYLLSTALAVAGEGAGHDCIAAAAKDANPVVAVEANPAVTVEEERSDALPLLPGVETATAEQPKETKNECAARTTAAAVERFAKGNIFDLGSLLGDDAKLSDSDMLVLNATGRSIVGPKSDQPTSPTHEDNAVSPYLANQQAAMTMFLTTSYERREWLSENERAKRDIGDGAVSLWLRTVGRQEDRLMQGDTAIGAESEMRLIHAGADMSQWSVGEKDRLHIGVMASYGEADNSTAAANELAKVAGAQTGVYATWYENEAERTGLYVDSWFSYSLFENSVLDTSSELYRAQAWAASFEAGYGFRFFGNSLQIEPQAQLIYASYDQAALLLESGHMIGATGGGLITRLGARIATNWLFANGETVQPYAEFNWWRAFHEAGLAFDGDAYDVSLPPDRFDVGLGINARLDLEWSLWARVKSQWGGQDYDGLEGALGFKYVW